MSSEQLWARLLNTLVEAAIYVVPLAAAALGAWLRERAKTKVAVKAAAEVEAMAVDQPSLRGRAKLEAALRLLETDGVPLIASMNTRERERMIERVLPRVRASVPPSSNPDPDGPTNTNSRGDTGGSG